MLANQFRWMRHRSSANWTKIFKPANVTKRYGSIAGEAITPNALKRCALESRSK
jgi:hypothetical protein